jgi:hypothetical protein
MFMCMRISCELQRKLGKSTEQTHAIMDFDSCTTRSLKTQIRIVILQKSLYPLIRFFWIDTSNSCRINQEFNYYLLHDTYYQ